MLLFMLGGTQLPGAFHAILSSSWLTKEPSEDEPGRFSLWVHKAITFHSAGITYLEEFKKPRRVTYLVNYFTDVTTSGERNDGAQIEVCSQIFLNLLILDLYVIFLVQSTGLRRIN